jgi:disulfide oxidoreductase YuzD
VKAAGFSIEISEDAVSQPLNPSIMYRSSSVDIANKLSTALKSKYPSIHFEMRGSDAIPENLKNVMIVNLTADVFK